MKLKKFVYPILTSLLVISIIILLFSSKNQHPQKVKYVYAFLTKTAKNNIPLSKSISAIFNMFPDIKFIGFINENRIIKLSFNIKDKETKYLLFNILKNFQYPSRIQNEIKINNRKFVIVRYKNLLCGFTRKEKKFLFKYAIFLIFPGLVSIPLIKRIKNSRFKKAEINHDTEYKYLFEENKKLNETIEELVTIREIGLAINSILDFDEMLKVICDVIRTNLSINRIAIYLIENSNRLKSRYIEEDGRRVSTEEFIFLDSPVGERLKLHLSFPENIALQKSFMLIMPLIAKGELIGAIKIERKNSPFTVKESDTLKLIVSHISIGINNARLYEMAITDGLTGLYVHRHFQFKLQEEIQRSKRNLKPVTLLMIDIDHFKHVNDTYGHQAGDAVLKQLSSLIKKSLRVTDYVFRYGGEEIAVILPETEIKNGEMIAEKLRKKIEENKFLLPDKREINVTVSIGVAEFNPLKNKNKTKDEIIKFADSALYRAKETGRNKVVVFT